MAITRKLAKYITNYDDKKSIGVKFRAKRINILMSLIAAVYKEHNRVEIIDIGGTISYWKLISEDYLNKNNVSITIVNLESACIPLAQERFKFIAADGCDLSLFENNAFNIVHSNSVIEHVGDWSRIVLFAKEVSRLAPKYFVQTPNYWFPIEPHFITPFFHWLPEPARIWLTMHFNLGHKEKADSVDSAVRTVESVRLLNKRMLEELFKDARIRTEKYCFLSKSFIAVKE